MNSYKVIAFILNEQRRIVAYLDNIQARLASLRRLQSQTQAELDVLLQSVLDRAFKGELTFETPIPFETVFGFDPRRLVPLAIVLRNGRIAHTVKASWDGSPGRGY